MDGFLTKRNIIAALVFLILAVSIPLGVKLVKEQTRLKSEATGSEIRFKGPNVSPDPCDPSNTSCVATDKNIEIEVTSPFGPPE